MKKITRLALFLLCTLPATSFSTTLQSQISAVAQAENQGKAELQAKLDEKEARQLEYRKKREREQAKRNQAQAQKAAVAENEYQKDKARNQSYEDQLRQLALEERKLELQRLSARAQREDDVITQELKKQAAQTDMIQSRADATRDISQGDKALMTSEGKAREKKAGKWFN